MTQIKYSRANLAPDYMFYFLSNCYLLTPKKFYKFRVQQSEPFCLHQSQKPSQKLKSQMKFYSVLESSSNGIITTDLKNHPHHRRIFRNIYE